PYPRLKKWLVSFTQGSLVFGLRFLLKQKPMSLQCYSKSAHFWALLFALCHLITFAGGRVLRRELPSIAEAPSCAGHFERLQRGPYHRADVCREPEKDRQHS